MRGPTLVRSVTVIMDPFLRDKLKENVGRVRMLQLKRVKRNAEETRLNMNLPSEGFFNDCRPFPC